MQYATPGLIMPKEAFKPIHNFAGTGASVKTGANFSPAAKDQRRLPGGDAPWPCCQAREAILTPNGEHLHP